MTEMSELGTVEYTIKKIIKADDAIWYKYGDRKILYQSTAYLKAGIDMSGFKSEDVKLDKENGTISVTFPQAKVLSFNMPLDEIKLEYCRVSGFRQNFTPEERLDLKQQAEAAIREDIPNMGILNDAEKNAKEFFSAMFSQFGYDTINVEFKKED